MANEIEHIGTSGLNYYAKPTPIVDTPWDGDVETLAETEDTGYFSADVASPENGYAIYRLAGESEASTDVIVGQVSLYGLLTHDIVGDIKDQTDQLTFTESNVVDANITHINETEVTGDGVSPKWGPA